MGLGYKSQVGVVLKEVRLERKSLKNMASFFGSGFWVIEFQNQRRRGSIDEVFFGVYKSQ